MYNTPPTYGIYVLGLVLEWVEQMGGVKVMQERAEKRSALLYDYLDSQDFYKAVAEKASRSHMNVTFRTGNDELDAKFAKESAAAGMSNLKGHRSVGGMRASIYNAMPIEGVEYLIDFMKKFAAENAKTANTGTGRAAVAPCLYHKIKGIVSYVQRKALQ